MSAREIKVAGKAARVRGATWTHDQVKVLFDVWTQPHIYQGLLHEKKKQGIFKEMATTLVRLGVERTWTECRAKIKNLKADFRKAMEKNTPFRYFEQMRKIMNVDGSSGVLGTPSPASSSAGGHSSGTRAEEGSDFEDNEIVETERITEPHVSTSPTSSRSPSTSFQYHFREDQESDPFSSRQPHSHRFSEERSTIPTEDSRKRPLSPESESFHFEKIDHHRDSRHEVEDSSSRSSMVITHVVSNVIEPVTTVIMPSSSKGLEGEETLPLITDQEPIRLEFVVDDDNLILQPPQSPSTSEHQPPLVPPQVAPQSSDWTADIFPDSPPSPISPHRSTRVHITPTPSRKPVRRPLLTSTPIRPRPGLKVKRPLPPSPPKDRGPSDKSRHQKRGKLLENLNRRTVETISNLLSETSHHLLKEIQDAEQRFISWEEQKRSEERKWEEVMFAKLIGALQQSSSVTSQPDASKREEDNQSEEGAVTSFTSVSKRLNDMVNDEIRATEETLRQWEAKMQRQEGRHTEKLFAMIINAMKVPPASQEDGEEL